MSNYGYSVAPGFLGSGCSHISCSGKNKTRKCSVCGDELCEDCTSDIDADPLLCWTCEDED